jgi:hypothetical protein
MSFFTLEPEASGHPAVGLAAADPVFTFDTWLGDDVVRAHAAILVTTPVKKALLTLPEPSGFTLARAHVRTSRFFRTHNRAKRVPPFWALQVNGHPGRDDMGLTPSGTLVVARRVLDTLLDYRIGRAVLAQYAPGKRSSRPTRR